MGELLEIASWVGTPIGGICAVAFAAACFFMGGGFSPTSLFRNEQSGCSSVRYPLSACKRRWLSCVDGMHECLVF
jgi:hypothetical protein